MKKSKFEEHSCTFKNESECEEELDDEGIDLDEAEEEFFEEN